MKKSEHHGHIYFSIREISNFLDGYKQCYFIKIWRKIGIPKRAVRSGI